MMQLYIICGHGGSNPYDSGAVGNGFEEAERVRVLGKRIKELGGDRVVLHDINDNAYASGAINTLHVPDGVEYQIVELHMDSADAPSAHGAHVIYKATYSPDEYDTALANAISTLFPGRSSKLVGTNNLANVNRAANRGIGYRLVENGFISNADDVAIFNANIDKMARIYLDAFGIPVVGESKPAEPVAPTRPTTGTANVPADPTQEELEDLADKTMDGRFGNGEDRKAALGSIYDKVQWIVDERNGKHSPTPEPTPQPQPTGKLTPQQRAVEIMKHMVTHDGNGGHGYSQVNRWGDGTEEVLTLSDGTQVRIPNGDFDCSSGVITAWEAAVPGCTADATYTGNMKDEFLATGLWQWHPMGNGYIAQPGDIYLNEVHHTAMCLTAEPDMLMQFSISENGTIHGNQGDQTGNESNIRSYYNYPWDGKLVYVGGNTPAPEPTPSPEPTPQPRPGIDVDGYWGNQVTSALQEHYGTPVDGVVSHQWPDNVRRNPGLTYGWETDYTQIGSTVIRALQQDLGVEADGLFGRDSIMALQRRLGTYVDGRLDAPSNCIKELQRRLNAGTF